MDPEGDPAQDSPACRRQRDHTAQEAGAHGRGGEAAEGPLVLSVNERERALRSRF